MTNLDQARSYIQTAPKAISGHGGDNTTFKVACTLVHGFALSHNDAMDLMKEYNARLDDQWTKQELNHKVTCALNYSSRLPSGYKLNRGAPFKPVKPALVAERMTWKINRKVAPTRDESEMPTPEMTPDLALSSASPHSP